MRASEPGRLTPSATLLAGLAGALLGWRPPEFWAATPAELATALAPFQEPAVQAPDPATIARLLTENPDG